jgi:glutathione-regulated potassium-efflux system ancillary protein KefC
MDSHGFIINIVVYLSAAVIAVPIFTRLGLGSVLGYLIAGTVIGPWGLGLINDVDDILHFSEFGVVLLLFLIGLELDPKKLWAMRESIIGSGGLQMLLTAAAIASVALLFDLSWQSSLIVGLGLALSSTAIALQTLQERNLLSTPAGKTGFAILLFQDIAVIPIIALIPLLGSTVNSGNPPQTELSALAIISIFTAIFLIGRFVLRHVFHFIAATHQREIFTALSLLLVCGMAAIMNLIGLSMALGAFIAGVLLADSEYRHTLESDIEPFKGLLLGLFFISVGMSIDFGLLLQNGWIIVLLTFALIVIKALVLWVVAMLAKIPVSQQALFSSVLSQSGEFGFVLFGFAATASALSYTLAHQLTLIVALSMALTPILLAINQRFIDPRFCTGEDLPMDEISADDGKNPVILVGYGRFGQVVGRLLNANKISTTVIDHNPHQIELVRRYGNKAYFGDALRSDVLHSAGAAQAKIIILAIDDKESTNQAVTLIKKTFPNLTIMARAFDRGHALHLVDLKVGHIKRETFYSALELGKDALVEMGLSVAQAQRVKNTLREHDIETLYQQVAIRDDEKALISVSHSARAQLENILAADQEKYQD